MMTDTELTEREREDLLSKVAELTERGILKKDDYVEILVILSRACKRRIAEIDKAIGPPSDVVQ